MRIIITEQEARAAVKHLDKIWNIESEDENFTKNVLRSCPGILENVEFRDTDDVKMVYMFFRGVEYGIQTVGRRGGRARVQSMSPKARTQSARRAARARWAKSQG